MSEEEQPTKVDKRKISSKQNMEKARKAKLEKLKQKKAEKHYEIQSESDDSSDSEDEVIVIQPKKKVKKEPKPVAKDFQFEQMRQEIRSEIQEAVKNLAIKKKKTKPKNSKQVIKIVNPPPQPVETKPNAELDTLKKRMLLNF